MDFVDETKYQTGLKNVNRFVTRFATALNGDVFGAVHKSCGRAPNLSSGILHVVEQEVNKYKMHQQEASGKSVNRERDEKWGRQICDASHFHWQLKSPQYRQRYHTHTHLDTDPSCSTCTCIGQVEPSPGLF